MTKKELNQQLDSLIIRMHTAPQRIGLITKVLSKANRHGEDKQLDDTMSYLGVCVSYLLFDNDCLRREVRRLKAKGDSN
jgi:hypothetical protein